MIRIDVQFFARIFPLPQLVHREAQDVLDLVIAVRFVLSEAKAVESRHRPLQFFLVEQARLDHFQIVGCAARPFAFRLFLQKPFVVQKPL